MLRSKTSMSVATTHCFVGPGRAQILLEAVADLRDALNSVAAILHGLSGEATQAHAKAGVTACCGDMDCMQTLRALEVLAGQL